MKKPHVVWMFLFWILVTAPQRHLAQTCSPLASFPFTGNADDASGNGNHGTVFGPVLTNDRDAIPNNAYAFNGPDDDYISINNTLGNFGIGPFTVRFWIQTSFMGFQNYVIGKRSACTISNFWNLMVKNGTIGFEISDPGNNYSVDGSIPVNDGLWHHIAAVRVDDVLKVYVDGQLDVSQGGFPVIDLTNSSNLVFGTNPCAGMNGTESYTGKLDDVEFFQCDIFECNDSNACTIDSGNTTSGCIFTPIDCDDGDVCTSDDCDTLTGCVNTPVIICDDQNLCTTDNCVNAQCEFTSVNCDDGDTCTSDDCDTLIGCVNTPVITCDDQNLCTTDNCVNLECEFTPVNCDDGDACTSDNCDTLTGCENTPVILCDDDDFCTTDECVNGVCEFISIQCDDGDLCTTDQCADGACEYFITIICDDLNDCTVDGCEDGQCLYDPIPQCCSNSFDCDDGNSCTTDECFNQQCEHSGIISPECCPGSVTIQYNGNPCSQEDVLLTVILNVPSNVESFLWNTGETTQDITVFPQPGTNNYSVMVVVEGGCNYTDNISFSQSDAQIELIAVPPGMQCTGSIVEIEMTFDGYLEPPITVEWSTGTDFNKWNTDVILTSGENTFSVTVTESNGCIFMGGITIDAADCPCNTEVDVLVEVEDPTVCVNESLVITVSSTDGGLLSGYFYSPMEPNESPDIVNIPTNPYVFVVPVSDVSEDMPLPFTAEFCFVRIVQSEGELCTAESCFEVTFMDTPCIEEPALCDEFELNSHFSWTKDVSPGADPNTYIFTNTSSILSGLQFTFIKWDFGGGETLTLFPPQDLTAPVSHTFEGEPPFTACLTVNYIDPVTNYCCSDEYCVDIQPGPCEELDIDVVVQSTVRTDEPRTVDFDYVHDSGLEVKEVFWNFGDGNYSTENPVTHIYAADGIYEPCVTVIFHYSDDPDICCPASDCDQVCIGDVMEHDEEPEYGLTSINSPAKNFIRVFPNPAESVFNVDFKNVSDNCCSIHILDVNGRILFEKNDVKDFETFDLSKHNSGIYFIKVIAGEKVFLKKIVKI